MVYLVRGVIMELTPEAREVAERFMLLPPLQRVAVLNLLRTMTHGHTLHEFVQELMKIPAEQREAWADALKEYLEEEKLRSVMRTMSGEELAKLIGEGVLTEDEAAELERIVHEYRESSIPK